MLSDLARRPFAFVIVRLGAMSSPFALGKATGC
jgi:hypothetical protein